MTDQQKEYSASSIKVMEGLEAVRKRPGMYIGTTSAKGLHHLVYEVVDNSVDEALAGYCNDIVVTLEKDGSCSVEDNGRGIPVDIHESEGISAAEVVMTKLHAGGKFDKDSYAFSGGLHGVGISVVNALSKKLLLDIYKDGYHYHQQYEYSKPLFRLEKKEKTDRRGTVVRFLPDETIFKETVDFNFNTLKDRLEELAYLNKGLHITLTDNRDEESKTVLFKYDDGIISFVKKINAKKEVLFNDVIYYKQASKEFELELAMQYNMGYDEQLISFVNNINTIEGGTHVSGFKSALTSACNKKAKELNILKKDDVFSSEDVREGMVCVLSIKLAEPQFEGQTKAKLGNHDIKGIVQSIISTFLDSYFEENPLCIKKILSKAESALRARDAARRARELVRKKGGLENTILPGKLADCSWDVPSKCELFIVEGDSAGGSAKTGRDRFSQAILPLRGKIINVEKAAIDRILKNEEIKALIAAIGGGISNELFNIATVRYHKIIIMTDADIDGAHIRTLLLTFFYRYMRPAIETGYIYIAQPPLYKAKIGRIDRYLKDEHELLSLVIFWARDNLKVFNKKQELTVEEKIILFNKIDEFSALINSLFTRFGIVGDIVESIINKKNFYKDDIRYNACIISEELEKIELFVQEFNIADYEFYHVKQDKTIIAISWYSLMLLFKALAKPFMYIQRYKGLGEMNPEQLWETAMDPKQRKLLQVELKDAEKAEYWFTTLMGEEVAHRKSFIEESAHFVKNLDI